MKITKNKLNQIIQEEYSGMLQEDMASDIEDYNREEAFASAVGMGDPEYGRALVDKARSDPGEHSPELGALDDTINPVGMPYYINQPEVIQRRYGPDRRGEGGGGPHQQLQPAWPSSLPGHPARDYMDRPYKETQIPLTHPGLPKTGEYHRNLQESLARQIERYIYENLKG